MDLTQDILNEGIRLLLARGEDGNRLQHATASILPSVSMNESCRRYVGSDMMPTFKRLLSDAEPDQLVTILERCVITAFQMGAYVGMLGGTAVDQRKRKLERKVI
jgi:hypothetical protein